MVVVYKSGPRNTQPHLKRSYHLTDNDLLEQLQQYDDVGYEHLPEELRLALEARGVTFETREPTEYEKLITVQDMREHRITNNELEIQDYVNIYLKGQCYV